MQSQSCKMDSSVPVVLYDKENDVEEADIENLYSDQLQRSKLHCGRGIRVYYYNKDDDKDNCDHSEKHNKEWRDEMDKGTSVEAGTVIALPQYACGRNLKRHLVVIQWDCGVSRAYTKEQLEKSCIRVFDLGPAGKNCYNYVPIFN